MKRPNSYPHALVDRLRQDPICLCCWLARGLTGRPCSTSIPNRWEIPLWKREKMFTHLKILKAEKYFSPIYRMRKYDNIDRGCIITSSNTHIYAKQQVIFKLYNLWVSKLWKLFCSEDRNRFQFEKEEGVAEFGKVESLESWGKMRLSIYNGEVNCPFC